MNILLVSYEFPPYTATGGIGSYMFHLSKLLVRYGHNVTVFSAVPHLSDITFDVNSEIIHYGIPAKTNEEFRKNAGLHFDTYIKTHQVDVVESPEVGACALDIKLKYPHIRLIVKLHSPGVLINKISRYYQANTIKLRFVLGSILRGKFDKGYWSSTDKNKNADVEYQICKVADILLSPSVALKNWIVKYWALENDKIKIVPNPFSISEELFLIPLDKRPHEITFVGKLSILKGMISLTRALPDILRNNVAYRVNFVGRDEIEDGKSMKQYMEGELKEFADRITFHGQLTSAKLYHVYANSQVCIFPSLWENYPTVILEAMAAGAAVIAANVGGIPEMIQSGQNGLLVNPYKPKEIINAVNSLLRNPDMRLEMVATARKIFKNQLGDKFFEENIVSVYR